MKYYTVFGVVLASEIELNLPITVPSDPSWRIERGKPNPLSSSWNWYHEIKRDDGAIWSRWAVDARSGDFLMDYDFCNFTISPVRRLIVLGGGEGLRSTTLQHLLVDQAVPHALSLDGSIVIHASAVQRVDIACAFLGASGLGKSTLASFLARKGWTFVTDDALRVTVGEEVRGFPGTARSRLWADSAEIVGGGLPLEEVAEFSDKQNVDLGSVLASSIAVCRIYLIGVGSHAKVEKVSMRDSFIGLAASSFRIALTDRDRTATEFRTLARLVTKGLVRRLHYPHDYSELDDVANAIEDDLATETRD